MNKIHNKQILILIMVILYCLYYSFLAHAQTQNVNKQFNKIMKDLMNPQKAKLAFSTLLEMRKDALPTIKKMLRTKSPRIVRAALDLTEKISDLSEETYQEIARIILNPRWGGLRVRAARIFGKSGIPLEKAGPILWLVLKDSNLKLRIAAAESLLEIILQRQKIFTEITKALKDPKNPLRIILIDTIAHYGRFTHPIMPILLKYFEKRKIEPMDVIFSLLPGLTSNLNLEKSVLSTILPSNLGDEEDIGPDSPAIEVEILNVDQADAAISFEDVPAEEISLEDSPAVEDEIATSSQTM